MKSVNINLSTIISLAIAGSFGLTNGWAEDAPKNATNVWSAPARAARKLNPIPTDTQSVAKGKDLFVTACVPCHGPAGQGNGPAAASLERKPANLADAKLWSETDGALFWKVTEGNTPMPSFREAFSDDQRWQVINYVRTLAPKDKDQTTVTKK